MSEISDLIGEYQRDCNDLAESLRLKEITGDQWNSHYERILRVYGMAAQDLGGDGAMDFKTWYASAQVDILNLGLTVHFKSYDPDQIYDAYLVGLVAIKTIGEFRQRLWAAVMRLYHSGSKAAFIGSFARSIDQQLTEAWNEGAKSIGVEPDEMSRDDMMILDAIIRNENDFIVRLAGDIESDRGMDDEPFQKKYGARVDLWANRYREVVNRARVVFGAKERYEWVMGPTEEHCKYCPMYNGIVAFGREWEQARVHPQMPPNPAMPKPEGCEGWRCLCELQPTNKRRTSRALDKIIDIVMRQHL